MKKINNKKSDFKLLKKMYSDHLAGPHIYQASKFWEKLNQLNIKWIKTDGIDNFKRSVNNNYFNWMVTIKSDYFLNVSRYYLRNIIYNPKKLWNILTTSIEEMYLRTFVSSSIKVPYIQKKFYALYLLFLYEYVKANDQFGNFKNLEEPKVGNPFVIKINGKDISQDISNSYMEYSYIRNSIGNNFSEIKTIAEIGCGYGRLSYLFHLLHKNDGLKVVLIDLPPALFIAQWYFNKIFPEAKIMKYRNFSNFSQIEQSFNESSICFLLPHQIELLPDNILDLLVNVSSLQEMSRDQINHYYELINQKAKFFYTKQWVFWENTDDKMSVPAIIYPTKPHWKLISARLNPVHTSFFEALFEIYK